MATRVVKDAKDINTNELIYFKGHAQATYLSDGSTVEEVLNNTLKQGASYKFNDTYNNPYLQFTYITDDNVTSNWICEIYNNAMFLGNIENTISIDSLGSITATSFFQNSDINKKNIIENVNLNLENIANAPAVKFTYKGEDNLKYVGTIALYWKKVLPEVVKGEEGNYTVDYASLATINSIQLAKIIVLQLKQIENLLIELSNISKLVNA